MTKVTEPKPGGISPVNKDSVTYSLGSPEYRSGTVLYPGHGGGVAQGDDEHVQEGGVWGHHQHGGNFTWGLLANYFYPGVTQVLVP